MADTIFSMMIHWFKHPCPCGSGKKYKLCCIHRQAPGYALKSGARNPAGGFLQPWLEGSTGGLTPRRSFALNIAPEPADHLSVTTLIELWVVTM